MALPSAGVRLVAEDANKFDSALKTAGSVLDGFGKTATSVAASVNNAFAGMASAVGNALRPLGKLFDQIFVSVIRSVVNDAIHQLERFASSVIQAAIKGSELETSISRLGVTLDNVAQSAFAPFVNQLSQMVNKAAPAFLGVVQAAESYLGGLGQSALVWGENFINQFAQGMWNAVGAILQVLTDVANMISYWLSPGSPPRLLPDIDQWGTAAANEFFGGWLRADFSIFNDLSGTLTNLIRSLAPSGGQSGIDVVSRILGTRQGIAAAVEELRTTGTVATSTIDAITAAVGSSDASVRAYLESMVRLQAANETVRQAQEELNRVTAEYEALLRPVNDEIAGITEEQQQLADAQRISLLQLTLRDPNATASEKRRAQLEIERIGAEQRRRALLAEAAVAVDAAQENLDTAKSAQELAQEEFDARRAQIAAQTEQNNLLREQIRLMEQLNRILGGGAAAGAGPKPPKLGGAGGLGVKPFEITPFSIEDFIPPDVIGKLNEFLAAFQAMWLKVLDVLAPAIDVWDNVVVPAWEHLVSVIVSTIPDIESAIAEMVAFVVKEMGVTLIGVFTNVASSLDSLAQIWDKHHDTILKIVVFTFKIIATVISVTMLLISGIIAAALRIISGTMDSWSLAFQGKWSEAWANQRRVLYDAWEIMKNTVRVALDAILLIVNTDMARFTASWRGVWSNAHTIVMYWIGLIRDGIRSWAAEIGENIRTSMSGIEVFWRGVWTQISLALERPLSLVERFWQALRDLWQWLQDHTFHLDLPGVPSGNTSSGGNSGGMSMAPPPTNTSGNPVYNSSSQGPTYNYSPTYQGAPPSPQHDFTIMQVFS